MSKKLSSSGCVVIILLIIMALPSISKAEAWMDSLSIRIADPKMERTGGNALLTFDIEIYRSQENWNRDDYTLGRSDFVFGKPGMQMSEVFSSLQVTSLRPEISSGMSTALQLEASFVLDRLSISLAPSSPIASPLIIPLKAWTKLCRVTLKLTNPTTVELGLLWDRQSTGCITSKNILIQEKLLDDLDKIPDQLLTFVDYSKSQTVCPNDDVLIFANAVSSGNGLTCDWEQDINGVWTTVPKVVAGEPGHENEWPSFNGYNYQMKGVLKDTLILRGLNTSVTGIYFKCVAKDLTLGSTPADNTRETPNIILKVLPEIQVALEGYSSPLEFKHWLESPNDTVYHCGEEAAMVRVAFYLKAANEMAALKNMGGKVYIEYKSVDKLGNEAKAQLEVKMADIGNTAVSAPSGKVVVNSDKFQLSLTKDAKYYISKVWTDSCSMGKVLVAYDSVIVKSHDNVVYAFDPITYVAGSPAIDVVNDLEGGINFTHIELKSGAKGSFIDPYYECSTQGTVGTDTLLYTYNQGCQILATRLVHIISSKSVAIKVFLEGPYLTKADSMACIYTLDLPGTETEFESPYGDNKTCPKPMPKFDRQVVDWVFVELWDYPPNGMTNSDTKKGNLIDSTSALLLSNGVVASLKGEKYLSFDKLPLDEYYVVVKHRNHLAIMSANKISFAKGTVPIEANTIDFTEKMENAFDIAGAGSLQSPLKSVAGKCVMYAGEILKLKRITIKDMQIVIETLLSNGYLGGDFNLDSRVTATDLKLINDNLLKYIKY